MIIDFKKKSSVAKGCKFSLYALKFVRIIIIIITQTVLSFQSGTTVVETLYRNKSSLEAIFRIIDKDNSGKLQMFQEEKYFTSTILHLIRRVLFLYGIFLK
jgi:hypothetical protein